MSNFRIDFPTKPQGCNSNRNKRREALPLCVMHRQHMPFCRRQQRAACSSPPLAGWWTRNSKSKGDKVFYTVLTRWSSSTGALKHLAVVQRLMYITAVHKQTDTNRKFIYIPSSTTHSIRPSIINTLAYDVPFTPGSQSTLQCVGMDFYFAGVNRVEKD